MGRSWYAVEPQIDAELRAVMDQVVHQPARFSVPFTVPTYWYLSEVVKRDRAG